MALSCDEAPSLASGIVVTFGPDRLVLISQPASPGTATCSATTHPATHPPGDMSGRRLRAVGADSRQVRVRKGRLARVPTERRPDAG